MIDREERDKVQRAHRPTVFKMGLGISNMSGKEDRVTREKKRACLIYGDMVSGGSRKEKGEREVF